VLTIPSQRQRGKIPGRKEEPYILIKERSTSDMGPLFLSMPTSVTKVCFVSQPKSRLRRSLVFGPRTAREILDKLQIQLDPVTQALHLGKKYSRDAVFHKSPLRPGCIALYANPEILRDTDKVKPGDLELVPSYLGNIIHKIRPHLILKMYDTYALACPLSTRDGQSIREQVRRQVLDEIHNQGTAGQSSSSMTRPTAALPPPYRMAGGRPGHVFDDDPGDAYKSPTAQKAKTRHADHKRAASCEKDMAAGASNALGKSYSLLKEIRRD
jgi:hypothetical protein